MNRAERRKLPPSMRQKPQVLDIKRDHATDIGAKDGDLVIMRGFRRSEGGGVEKCEHGKETPFRVNVVG